MGAFPAEQLKQQEIERVIEELDHALAPDLVFVGYSVANDDVGSPCIFFRCERETLLSPC